MNYMFFCHWSPMVPYGPLWSPMVPYGPLWSPGHSVGLPLEVADLNSWGFSVLIGAGTDWHWESSNFNDSVLWRRRVDQIFRHPVGRKSNLQSAGRDQKDGQKLKVIAGHHLPSSIFLSLTSGIKKLMNSCCTQNGFWCVWMVHLVAPAVEIGREGFLLLGIFCSRDQTHSTTKGICGFLRARSNWIKLRRKKHG